MVVSPSVEATEVRGGRGVPLCPRGYALLVGFKSPEQSAFLKTQP